MYLKWKAVVGKRCKLGNSLSNVCVFTHDQSAEARANVFVDDAFTATTRGNNRNAAVAGRVSHDQFALT